MAKPYIHAVSSAKQWGGKPEDYLEIHDWFDQTKAHLPDGRHRALLHHSFGIFLCEQVFGVNITNSEGKLVSVRAIGEQHCLEDFGMKFIPTVQDYFGEMPYEPWMNNAPGTFPPSYQQVEAKRVETKTTDFISFDKERIVD